MTIAIHVDQQRDESMLGASEAAGVLGLDRYNPPIAVWRRHRGLSVPADEDNEPALWGRILEPVVRGKYAVDRQVRVWVPTGSYTRDGWLRCTPDGIVDEDPGESWRGSFVQEFDPHRDGYAKYIDASISGGTLGGLQVKTCSAWLEDDWRAGPPAKYEVQCRVEMAVADLPWVDIVCLCGGQRQLGPFRIYRDQAIEDRILSSLREFWTMVQEGREPSPDSSDAWRMHVAEKMERAKPVVIVADDIADEDLRAEVRAELKLWRDTRAHRVRAVAAELLVKNQIMLRLSAAQATRIEDGRDKITAYKTKGTWALKAPRAWKDD